MVTNGDKKTITKGKHIRPSLALYRGVYSRVARELGLDRSYVSRVASGQRHSPQVEQALLREIERIEKLAKSGPARPGKATARKSAAKAARKGPRS